MGSDIIWRVAADRHGIAGDCWAISEWNTGA